MPTMARRLPVTLALLLGLAGCPAGTAQAAGPGNPPAIEKAPPDEDPTLRRDLENDPDLYLQLIDRLQGKHLFFASLAHLDAFDKRWPGNPRAILLRADALREVGYLDKAGALYEGLLNGPLAASALHGLGLIASRKDDLKAALQALTRASELDPTSAALLNDLGYVQLLQQQMADAGFNLHKATELDPKNARAGANLALFYMVDNKPARAEGIMDWYRLNEKQRKEIIDKAAALAKRISP
jgi:Flp pilus assembly protein TadD